MPTFAELLTAHIERSGIGDADLARRIGVSRLTLIRWKEGSPAVPATARTCCAAPSCCA